MKKPHMNYTNTKYNPPTSPDKSAIENLASSDKAAAVKLSSGPKTPDPLEAPGLGAWPLSASPPPLRLCVAVGRGDADFVEVELPPPDAVELFPEPEAFEEAVLLDDEAVSVVNVMTTAEVIVVCSWFELMPVETNVDVERT